MNYMVLKIFQVICKYIGKERNVFFSSMIGAVGACLIVTYQGITSSLACVFSVFLSFCMVEGVTLEKRAGKIIRNMLVFYGVSALFCGILYSLYEHLGERGLLKMLLPFAVLDYFTVVFLLTSLQKEQKRKQNLYLTEIQLGANKIQCMALLDTGNQLREPFSKKPVVLIEKNKFQELYDIRIEDIGNQYDTVIEKIHPIPYQAVGVDNGILLGILCDQVNIQKHFNFKTAKRDVPEWSYNQNVMVAIYNGKFSKQGDYCIILHEELLHE